MDGQVSIEALQGAWLLDQQNTPGVPMNRRLYWLLRRHILEGSLPAGVRLPASRQLAQALGVARNTVIYAFDLLQAEGFLVGQTGDGTYVAAVRPTEAPDGQGVEVSIEAEFSTRGQQALGQQRRNPAVIAEATAFVPGIPGLADFPLDKWLKTLSQTMRRFEPGWIDYVRQGGVPALKVALARHLRLTRALQCEPSQILITSGTQQSLDLLMRCLADVGEVAWIEDPGYNGARSAMLAAGLAVVPVPVDDEGLHWQSQRSLPTPRLIYITPSHQYPLGSVMSLERRQALLSLAATSRAWVLEDDYDSEFRYDGPPLTALQGLDQASRVIYMGTFSKVMFPGLQLGYVVLPAGLVNGVQRVQARLYRESQYLMQAALAEFMESGQFATHLRKMRGIYANRQRLLRATVEKGLPGQVSWLGGESGLHVVLSLPATLDDRVISEALLKEGIVAPPLSHFFGGAATRQGLVLGYAGVPDAEIPPAATRLVHVLKAYWPAVSCANQY